MKKLTLLIALLYCYTSVLGQAPDWLWAKGIGGTVLDEASFIITDNNGNLYVTGEFWDTVDFDPGLGINNLISNGTAGAYILKLDYDGNFIWAKKIIGTQAVDGRIIQIDTSGNIYMAGNFYGTADFNPDSLANFNLTSVGNSDPFILKLNSNGNFVWAKSFGGSSYDWMNSMDIDSSGNIYVTGSFSETVDFNPDQNDTLNLTAVGNYDIYISKLNNSGNLIWAKRIGGTENDIGEFISRSNEGNIYLIGEFNNVVDFNPDTLSVFNMSSMGANDIFISKFDSLGNFIWAERIGGATNDEGKSFALDDSENIYITGVFEGNVEFNPGTGIFTLNAPGVGSCAYVFKLDSSGNFDWAKSLGGSATSGS